MTTRLQIIFFGRAASGAVALVAAALALGGCSAGSSGEGGSFRERMGLAAPPPDPFLTVARAPLELPGDMQALPPPRPGAPSRVEPDPQAQARAALLGERTAGETQTASAPPGRVGAPPSEGESALVAAAARTAPPDPDVRETLVAEQPEPERRFGLDNLLGFPIVQDPEAEAQRLEPEAEAERLREEGRNAPVAPPSEDD